MNLQRHNKSMQYKVLLLAIGATLFGASCADASTRVAILGYKNEIVRTVQSVKLASDRLAIPASTFEFLGLAVGYDDKERRVYISIPESDIMVGLRAGAHRSYHPETGYVPNHYPYPLARKLNGHFYISIHFMQKAFPDYFSYSWNKDTKTIVIKRRHVSE